VRDPVKIIHYVFAVLLAGGLLSSAMAAGSSGQVAAAHDGGQNNIAPRVATAVPEGITRTNAIAEFGAPLYADGFTHWPYANPDAPKGGRIRLGSYGSFDSLNPYILKGQPAAGLGLISDSLMTGSGDELFAAYGLIASSVEYPKNKSWALFTLRPEARWHDGARITADDFIYALEVIRAHGRPFLRAFYDDVEKAESLPDGRLKFTFKTRDSMKPLMAVAGLSPLPRHYWENRKVDETTLDPPLGCGPYKISVVDAGRSITYERVADYWGRDLPVNRGLKNFDHITYDYYRDDTVMFEAFKAGKIDFRQENKAQRWSTGYDLPEVKSGAIIRREVADETPQGLQGFFFNLRRAPFSDLRIRKAFVGLYDFEAVQRMLLYGKYVRSHNYFIGDGYGSEGAPEGAELALLEPFRTDLPAEMFMGPFLPPKTNGSGNLRAEMRRALQLFKEAGWTLKDGKLQDRAGQQMRLEVLLDNETFVRIAAPFMDTLKRAGIDASIRVVDSAQYQQRLEMLDFDMIMLKSNFFPPPGPELRSYYGSAAADIGGSGNWAGIKSPVVDALIEKVIAAKSLEDLKTASRALDRVLLWGNYVVPHWHNDSLWLAYWNKFGHPEHLARYSVGFPATWWQAAPPIKH